MARSIWKGAISFGLVNIPVTLHAAEERSEKVSFNMLDKRDMSPIGYQRINKDTGKTVAWDDIVKGYEVEDGQYVIVTDEDFRKANPRSTQVVEILDFVDAAEIEPSFAQTPYYLEPGKNGAKAYALLREALKRTGKAGIAKVVIHTRQHLAAVMARGDVLLLEILRFAHELRDPKKLDLPGHGAVSDREVAMAERLVEGMTSKWQPSKYRDDYTEDLMALIKRKAKHGDVEEVEEPEELKPTNVVDLMPLLKKSLEKAEGGKRATRGAAAAHRTRKRAPAHRKKAARRRSA